jgi:hypothetical protein
VLGFILWEDNILDVEFGKLIDANFIKKGEFDNIRPSKCIILSRDTLYFKVYVISISFLKQINTYIWGSD